MRIRGAAGLAFLMMAAANLPAAGAQEAVPSQDDEPKPTESVTAQPAAPGHRFISATGGQVTIAASSSATWTFAVPDHAIIADLDVGIDIEVSQANDVTVELEHQSPTQGAVAITLIDQPGLPGNDCLGRDVDVALSDEAAVNVEDGCAATTPTLLGRYAPAVPLTAFDGRDVRGDWTLTVTNDGLFEATLQSWALHVKGVSGFEVGLLRSDGASTVADVSDKLWAEGGFDAIWSESVQLATASPAVLSKFDAVLVWSNFAIADGELLGDRLAAYVDDGGGVVIAMFAHGFAGTALGGAIMAEPYAVMNSTLNVQGVTETLNADLPTHPIFDGVTSFAGETRATDVVVPNAAHVIGTWSGGQPLVATRATVDGRIVGLNFWPSSSDVSGFAGWDATTDGAAIMANSLKWSTTKVVLCNGLPPTREGGPLADVIDGSPGVDVIVGRGGGDTLRGLGGKDHICGGPGNDDIFGNGGADTLLGQSGADDLRGAAGNDTLVGGDGNDTMTGHGGADTFRNGKGNDAMVAGLGTDTLDLRNVGVGLTVNLASGTGSGLGADSYAGFEEVLGTPHADLLIGGAGADVLVGNGGSDELIGNGGGDTLTGSQGNDVLRGRAGNDDLAGGRGSDDLFGGPGADDLAGGPGSDLLNGGPGADSCVGGETLISC